MESIPVPSEINVPSAFPAARPGSGHPPSLTRLAPLAYLYQTKKERLFRNGKPVPTSNLLATNIASAGVWGPTCHELRERLFRSGRNGVRWCYTAILRPYTTLGV